MKVYFKLILLLQSLTCSLKKIDLPSLKTKVHKILKEVISLLACEDPKVFIKHIFYSNLNSCLHIGQFKYEYNFLTSLRFAVRTRMLKRIAQSFDIAFDL